MAHVELDHLQACLNFALDTLRKEMDKSRLPPLSQQSSVAHPLDDSTTYLPSKGLFEARRLSLACLGELKNLIQSPLDRLASSTTCPMSQTPRKVSQLLSWPQSLNLILRNSFPFSVAVQPMVGSGRPVILRLL